MCLCVVVVFLFRLCHITRVYVGFSFLPVIYTVSLSPQSRLSVVFVPFCTLIYLFLAFYCVFFVCLQPPTDLCFGKQQRALQRFCLEKWTFYADAQINMHVDAGQSDLPVKPYSNPKSAVLRVGLSKAQGLWGRWSHLGQGIVPLETCHAKTSQYLDQLACHISQFSSRTKCD